MINYFRAVAPARGYAIHDTILNDDGLGLMTRMLSVAAAPGGVPVAGLEPGSSLTDQICKYRCSTNCWCAVNLVAQCSLMWTSMNCSTRWAAWF